MAASVLANKIIYFKSINKQYCQQHQLMCHYPAGVQSCAMNLDLHSKRIIFRHNALWGKCLIWQRELLASIFWKAAIYVFKMRSYKEKQQGGFLWLELLKCPNNCWLWLWNLLNEVVKLNTFWFKNEDNGRKSWRSLTGVPVTTLHCTFSSFWLIIHFSIWKSQTETCSQALPPNRRTHSLISGVLSLLSSEYNHHCTSGYS